MNHGLIQVGGKTYKNCEVLILPTEQETRLFRDTEMYSSPAGVSSQTGHSINSSVEDLMVYIVSKDDFKEGSYVLHSSGYFSKVLGFNRDAVKLESGQFWTKDCKKVVAMIGHDILPRPSDSFLEKLAQSCNKKRPIKEIFVEFVESQMFVATGIRIPKIANDGTISIKPSTFDLDPKIQSILSLLNKNLEFNQEFVRDTSLRGEALWQAQAQVDAYQNAINIVLEEARK